MQTNYQHRFIGSDEIMPAGKVVCVGRNYIEHIKELNNTAENYPVIFCKPNSALCDFQQDIKVPKDRGECHYETELAFLVNEKLTDATENECRQAIIGVGMALDLTLRDLQSQLKERGLPWERAKAFDSSCPVTPFVKVGAQDDLKFQFSLNVNGAVRQSGSCDQMIWPTLTLISLISREISLLPGDIVITGTPKGVSALHSGDKLVLNLKQHFEFESKVI